MRPTVRLLLVLPLLALSASGCQPINYDKTYSLEAGIPQGAGFDAPRYAQKLQITVTPTDAPVSTYVVKDPDKKFADDPPVNAPVGEAVIASKVSTAKESYTFEANVPAKMPYTILLYAKKKTDAKFKVSGR